MDLTIIDDCMKYAAKFHAGQLDKSGHPYIGHLERTATMVRLSGGTWVQECAAWLHDSIEDTEASQQILLELLPGAIVRIIVAMTHIKNMPNEEYWAQVKACPEAILVKLCDIYDNTDPSRMCHLPVEAQIRLRKKYANAVLALMGE